MSEFKIKLKKGGEVKTYCLSDCAKYKLSKAKQISIDTAVASAVFTVIVSIVALFGWVTGVIAIYLQENGIVEIFKKIPQGFSDVAINGAAILLVILIFGVIVFLVGVFAYNVFRTTSNIIKNKLEGDTYGECKIFEECTNE